MSSMRLPGKALLPLQCVPKFVDDSVEASMAVNARGIFVTCRAFAKSMAANSGGSIINVSSIHGLVAPDPKIMCEVKSASRLTIPTTRVG
jgi:NAD(P)-dependent dehydrogenase (short-subunit alcohol dehydrogenase family)